MSKELNKNRIFLIIKWNWLQKSQKINTEGKINGTDTNVKEKCIRGENDF